MKIAALMAAFAILTGCATLTDENSSAKLTTYYATLKVIDGDADKAARVRFIATEVQRYASGEEFLTVDLLVTAIKDQVRWDKLDAADELLVHALIDELRAALVRRFGADVLPEDLRLAVDTVATWVITASGT